jgi:hypothetical protein
MRFLRRIWKISLPLAAAFVCLGCISGPSTEKMIYSVEKMGQFIGRSLPEKTAVAYIGRDLSLAIGGKADKDGGKNTTIGFDEFPYLQMHAKASPDGSFLWTELRFFGASPFGWNEFTQEITGAGNAELTENFATLSATAPEYGRILSANILHNGEKLQGEEALTSLRRRSERIEALAEWMRAELNDAAVHFPNEKAFETYWKPILLPETVSRKKRPSVWQDTGDWTVAEDVKWNVSYTKDVFPEHLRTLRDSGALLRDWEEALSWLYFAYEWNYIQGLFSAGETTLVKK